MAWKIFIHSFQMFANNLSVVFRIVLVPWLLIITMVVVSNLIRFGRFSPLSSDMNSLDGGDVPWALFVTVVYMSIYTWIIVGWHRFVLLGEIPNGWVPNWHGRLNLDYFIKGILVGLVLLIPLILFGIIIALFGTGFIHGVIFSALITVLSSFLFLRLSLILPAAALGVPMKIGVSWAATKDASKIIWGLAALLMALSLVVNLLPSQGIMSFVTLFLSAVVGLLSVGILTTLYGVLVEKREL